jgi:hypothetical protein
MAIIKTNIEYPERYKIKYQILKNQSITAVFTGLRAIKTTVNSIKIGKKTQNITQNKINKSV